MTMESLIKSLTDEVDNTRDAVTRLSLAKRTGRSAEIMQAEADIEVGFAKVNAHLAELRRRLNL
jgi:hypothetical protein